MATGLKLITLCIGSTIIQERVISRQARWLLDRRRLLRFGSGTLSNNDIPTNDRLLSFSVVKTMFFSPFQNKVNSRLVVLGPTNEGFFLVY
jgi:hypothetical protein